MNLLLFSPDEISRPLPWEDERARHLREVLRREPGQSFEAGVVNGPRGTGTIQAQGPDGVHLAFRWGPEPPALDDITLMIGLPRPQTARDILRDATSLGVAEIRFVHTERGDANYGRSTLWQSEEWRRHLLLGAAQACDTRIPIVSHGLPLAESLAGLRAGSRRLALDNYEAPASLASIAISRELPLVLALGPERGWGPQDRAHLRAAGFELRHLGARVLRLEIAVVAALALVKAARGSL